MKMKKEAIEELLRGPNVAVVAVTAPDGAPHAVPTWYEYRNGEIVFATDKTAFKYRCLTKDSRVTFVVDTKTPPYKTVVLKGRATLEERTDDERLLRLSIAYLGEKNGRAYAALNRGPGTVWVRLKAARMISWDYSDLL
ncbi:MAG TPA: TIGR03618 family F420-dependent PPOX class oxidoreductase [Candidatus Binataceae bacterium]|jgi:PPOX class probable F420-dependent enzyme